MSVPLPLSGISGLSFDFPFLSPLLFLLPSPLALSVLSCFCYWSILRTFFLQKTLKYFSLRVRLFCMALVEQLGDDSWQVVCAACCHMTLVFAIMHLYNILKFYMVSVHSSFIFFFNLILINLTEWSTIPACPSLMCSFNRGNIEGTNSSKICV